MLRLHIIYIIQWFIFFLTTTINYFLKQNFQIRRAGILK